MRQAACSASRAVQATRNAAATDALLAVSWKCNTGREARIVLCLAEAVACEQHSESPVIRAFLK